MTESTPISSPSTTDASNPVPSVPRASSFPHKTSAATAPVHQFIETNTPAINAVAVELDGVPMESASEKTDSGEKHDKGKLKDTAGGTLGNMVKGGEGNVGLAQEEDIEAEFLGEGEKGEGRSVREKRAALLSTRSKDPGVIVDLPQDPTAEEVQAAKSAEGTVTPAVPVNEGR